ALIQAQALHFQTPAALTEPFCPLSLWRGFYHRVRGFNETLGTLTPHPLPVGEGARTEEALYAARQAGQDQGLHRVLGQDAVEHVKTFRSFQVALAARFEHHADVFRIAGVHAALAPQGPVDGERLDPVLPRTLGLVAGKSHLETVADGVVTGAEIAQDGRGGGEVADEVKRIP